MAMALDVALVKISGSARLDCGQQSALASVRVECGINLIVFGHTDGIIFIDNCHEEVSNIFSYSVEQVIAVHGVAGVVAAVVLCC